MGSLSYSTVRTSSTKNGMGGYIPYPLWASIAWKRRRTTHTYIVKMWNSRIYQQYNSGPESVPAPKIRVSTGWAYSAASPNGAAC